MKIYNTFSVAHFVDVGLSMFIIIFVHFPSLLFCVNFQGPNDSSHRAGTYAGIYLGDPDIGELTISEMSPEDIRAELKR